MIIGWVFVLISSGSPHARCTRMWALSTRGDPDDIGFTPHGGLTERLGRRTRALHGVGAGGARIPEYGKERER